MANLKDEYNILYIDGNETRKKQFSSRLRMQAFNVELAQGGFHALHLVEKQSFNLVIIQGDEIEDMPAHEITSLMRSVSDRDKLPILALLPEADDEYACTLAESGANEIKVYQGNFNMVLQEIEKIQGLSKKKK